MKIYIAGAHRELDRCASMIIAADAIPDVEVTLDWTGSIRKHGGDQNDDRPIPDRAETAWADVDAVIAADVVWLLLPRAITKGMHTELGVALCYNRLLKKVHFLDGPKIIIASWQDSVAARDEDLPLFVATADLLFDNDADALEAVRGVAMNGIDPHSG